MTIHWQEERGMTLVELMAAMVVTTIVVGAGLTTLVTSNKASRANSQAADTQQNVRLVMSLISNDLRMAGFGMRGPVGNCATAIVPADHTPGGPDRGPDSVSLAVPTTGTATPWTVTANTTGTVNLPLSNAAIQQMLAAGLVAGSRVMVGGAFPSTVATTPAATATQITLNDQVATYMLFPSGTPVYLLQCITYQVLRATDANATICGGNTPCLVRGVAPLNTAVPARPDCRVTPNTCVAIADGVEDLQLAYGCDGCNVLVNGGTPDGVVDNWDGTVGFSTGDLITDSTWSLPPQVPDSIRTVQVTIVARQVGSSEGIGEGSKTPGAYTAGPLQVSDHNHALDVGYDVTTYVQFRRRVLQRMVQVRNVGI